MIKRKSKSSTTTQKVKPARPIQTPKVKRDNFSKETARQLREMAGNMCSHPDCRVITNGAKKDRGGAVSIGVACHIRAAAPGGPRYDINQTTAERKSLDNGIWMCQTHSKWIDADDSPYPPDLLFSWKAEAESRSGKMINTRVFTSEEAESKSREDSVKLLHSYIAKDSNPIGTPVLEVIEGYAAGLSSLDPRFKVDVESREGVLHHKIEPVDCSASFNLRLRIGPDDTDFAQAERLFREEGAPLVIEGPNFSFSGSRLMESIHDGMSASTLELRARTRKVRTSLYVVDEDREAFIADYESVSTQGSKRAVVRGDCLMGLFKSTITFDLDGGDTKLDLNYAFEAWLSKDVAKLPYFSRLVKAVPLLEKGGFAVDINVDGVEERFVLSNAEQIRSFCDQIRWGVKLLEMTRKIASHCRQAVHINSYETDGNVFEVVPRYLALAEAGAITEWIDEGKVISEGYISELHDEHWWEKDIDLSKQDLMLSGEDRAKFKIFGNVFLVPRVNVTIKDGTALLFCDINEGRKVNCQIVSGGSSSVTTSLNKNDKWEVGS